MSMCQRAFLHPAHLVVGLLGVLAAADYGKLGTRFLLISSPSTGNVYYSELPSEQILYKPLRKRNDPPEAKLLIDGELSKCKGSECDDNSDEGLKSPTGLALYKGPSATTLFVSDAGSENIYAYEIARYGGAFDVSDGIKVGRQRRVRQGVQGANGLVVDGAGNLFYTTSSGKVEMISAAAIAHATGSGGNASSAVLYDSRDYDAIDNPSDIATDGYHLFWTNIAGGMKSGSVADALKTPQESDTMMVHTGTQRVGDPRPLAANGNGAWGVCYARGNVFYTAEQSLFAVPAAGGSIAEVTHQLQQPRGCAFDGEATLYVADSAAGAIFSLVASPTLRAVRHLNRVVSVESPSQVVVFDARGWKLKDEAIGEYRSGATQGCHRSNGAKAMTILAALAMVWRS